ncbi:type IV toxin-antitoxin system AbiEi family antitoxin domain-containing protein [Solirubrobacter taibaiensis]|nr:type IV toxin-antitoxin system AbiEi family antitoxin domain-containing protein [Solirubrobacter taibaiensis]
MPAHLRLAKVAGHTPRQIAARQRDLITTDQLLSAGLSAAGITRRVRASELRRVFKGVYTFSSAPLSREARWLATALACGESAGISHFAAGTHLGVSRFHSSLIDVVSPRKRTLDGVRVHFTRTLQPQDITTHKGIPVTRFRRLLVDFADVLTPFQLANVLHRGALKGLVPPDIPEAPGRHNTTTLHKAFALHESGSTGTRSTAEDVFLTFDLPEPLVNVAYLGFEVDFRWPEQRVAVEVDSPPHGRPYNRAADVGRDTALDADRYTVLRFSADDVQSYGRQVAQRVRDALSVRPTS